MKLRNLFCLVLLLISIVIGCQKKEPEPSPQAAVEAEEKPTKPRELPESTKRAELTNSLHEAATDEPNPKVDYVAKINELAKAGRDESLNAAPFYQKAIELYVKASEEQTNLARKSWPTDFSTKQQSLLKEWVQSNSEALSQLEMGTRKPHYWLLRSSKDGTVMAIQTPEFAELRDLCSAIVSRAKLAAAEGDIDKAVADIVTCYRLGLHVSDESLLIDQLVGTAIRAIAVDTAFEVLDRTKMGQASMKFLQSQIEQLSTDESYIPDMTAEKFCMLDVIQRIFTDDGKGGGQISQESVKTFSELTSISQEIWGDYTPAERLERNQTTETVVKLYGYFDFVARKTPWQWKNEEINPKEEITKIMNKNLVVQIFCPSFDRLAKIFPRCRSHTNALITTLALLRYKVDKGRLPEKLNELVSASYLKTLANDPFSGRPLVYNQLGQDFNLYSFGEDCDDDGGEVVRDSKGKVKKWADAGDCVFWPVEPPN